MKSSFSVAKVLYIFCFYRRRDALSCRQMASCLRCGGPNPIPDKSMWIFSEKHSYLFFSILHFPIQSPSHQYPVYNTIHDVFDNKNIIIIIIIIGVSLAVEDLTKKIPSSPKVGEPKIFSILTGLFRFKPASEFLERCQRCE
jgi:hypothetical protein